MIQKTTVLAARNGGFSFKKQRFLKQILIFVGIEMVYHADYQCLSSNAKTSVFRQRKTTHRQISPVFALRTAGLLILLLFFDYLSEKCYLCQGRKALSEANNKVRNICINENNLIHL